MLVTRISNQSMNFIGTLNDISHFWNVKMAHDFRKKFGNSVHSMRAQTCNAVLRIALAVFVRFCSGNMWSFLHSGAVMSH